MAKTIQSIVERAKALMKKTEPRSITPTEVGQLHVDTLENVDQNASDIITVAKATGTLMANISDLSLQVSDISPLVVATKPNESASELWTRISSLRNGVVLMVANHILIDSTSNNVPTNVVAIIGCGGNILASEPTPLRVMPDVMIESKLQLFGSKVYVTTYDDSGYIRGLASPIWWGAKSGVACQDEMDALMDSRMMDIEFPDGVWVAYINNRLSGRNLYFRQGCVIDGIVHISYGSLTYKTYCCNTTVYGKVVSTIRVGGAYIDGLSMRDGIRILGVDSQYVNQTAAGGCKGVHFNYDCHNVEIGDVAIDEVIPLSNDGVQLVSYAVGIDYQSGHTRPHDIYIKSISVGSNTSTFYDLMLVGTDGVVIDRFVNGGGSSIVASVYAEACNRLSINDADIKYSNTSGYGAYLDTCKDIMFGQCRVSSDTLSNWGIFLYNSEGLTAHRIAVKNQQQGVRYINSKQSVIANMTSISTTTATASYPTDIAVLHTETE